MFKIIEIIVNENAAIYFELWPELAPIACKSIMRCAEKKILDGRAIERLEHVAVEEAIEPLSGITYHRPVKTEMTTKVRVTK